MPEPFKRDPFVNVKAETAEPFKQEQLVNAKLETAEPVKQEQLANVKIETAEPAKQEQLANVKTETAKPVKQEQVHRQWKAGDLRMNGPAGNLEIAEHAYVEGCCWIRSFCQNNCNTRRLINKRNYTLPQEVIKIDEMSRHDFFYPKLQPLQMTRIK